MLSLENPTSISFVSNELESRHGQRALRGYHYQRKKGETQWELIVSGFEVTPIFAAVEVP